MKLLALNASVEAARAGSTEGFCGGGGRGQVACAALGRSGERDQDAHPGTVGRIKNGDEMMAKTSSSLEELDEPYGILFQDDGGDRHVECRSRRRTSAS